MPRQIIIVEDEIVEDESPNSGRARGCLGCLGTLLAAVVFSLCVGVWSEGTIREDFQANRAEILSSARKSLSLRDYDQVIAVHRRYQSVQDPELLKLYRKAADSKTSLLMAEVDASDNLDEKRVALLEVSRLNPNDADVEAQIKSVEGAIRERQVADRRAKQRAADAERIRADAEAAGDLEEADFGMWKYASSERQGATIRNYLRRQGTPINRMVSREYMLRTALDELASRNNSNSKSVYMILVAASGMARLEPGW